MKLLQIILAISAVFMLSGCENLVNDLDEDELPRVESKLTLSCYISPQSPEITVRVTESQPLLGPADYNPRLIPNANVVLTDGAAQVLLPYDDSLGIYRIDSEKFKIQAGQTYTLLVDDSKRSVKATCTVPVNNPVMKMEFTKEPTSYNSDSMLTIHTSWTDIRGEKNYYALRGYLQLRLRGPSWDPATGKVSLVDNNYAAEFWVGASNENLFTDTNLDGATFRGPVITWFLQRPQTHTYTDNNGVQQSYSDEARITKIQMQVMNMDEHYYRFQRSVINARNDNPFTEPTPVYTNVEGGLGCFGAYNAAIVTRQSGW